MTWQKLGLFAVLTTALSAAPIPKEAKDTIYFPLTVGTRWVYETPRGDESAEVAEVVKDGDRYIVSRRGINGTAVRYAKMVVTVDGLQQEREEAENKLGFVLKTKLKSGESWELPDETKRTVFGPEEVRVPAGKFNALRVEWGSDDVKFTSWYAPGVGEIKRTLKITGEAETIIRSLKSFRVGEGKK